MNEAALPKYSHRVPPIPAPMKKAMETERVYLFNVGPWEHRVHLGTMGMFLVPACPEGATHSPSVQFEGKDGIPSIVPQLVIDQVEGFDVTHKWDFSTEGRQLAKNILGQTGFAHPTNDLTQYGVFLSSSPVPSDAEIEAACEKLAELYDKRVREADQAYEINGGMQVGEDGKSYSSITKDHIQACKALGLERPWARKNVQMVSCDECGQSNLPTTAFCKCGNMLNEEQAKRKFPARYAELMGLPVAEPKRGPGRPKPEVA